MSKLQPLLLLLSFGAAFAMNHLMRPRLNYELPPGERSLTTGSLRFDESAAAVELKLATVHVLKGEIRRAFSDPEPVRELWIRTPEQDGQSAPDLELFFDLPMNERDMTALEKRELKLRSVGKTNQLRSRVRLPGADHQGNVGEGTLVLDEVLPSDVPGSFRVEGKLELFVKEGDGEQHLRARISARVMSD